MRPIEVLAFLFLLIATIKILVLLIKPAKWSSVVNVVYAKNKIITSIIALIVAAVSLYYLLQEITIIHIFATMIFVSALLVLGATVYAKEVTRVAKSILKDKKLLRKSWLALLVWIVLMIWGFAALFF